MDGSTDGTDRGLVAMAAADRGLKVHGNACKRGKGAALLEGLAAAAQLGYTHVLTMDSDGQHPADRIPAFMSASAAAASAMILGAPLFDSSAPRVRVNGRRISNWFTNLETLWSGIQIRCSDFASIRLSR